MALADPQPRKIRVVNTDKQARKTANTERAISGKSSAHKKQDAAAKRALDLAEKVAKLEGLADEKKTEEVKNQIDLLNKDNLVARANIAAAKAEEVAFNKAHGDALMEDVYDVVENPDFVKVTTEIPPPTVNEDLAALFAGTYLTDPKEFLDLDQGSGLRNTQAVIGYKGGFGTTAIVYDHEVPNWAIFRLRKDVVIDEENLPNFIDRRRGGKAKTKGGKELWRAKDIRRVKGIAIEVPIGYSGNPENLVELIPRLSGTEKDKLKKAGKRIPQQPGVQLLIEWLEAMKVETAKGVEEAITSWESRSGCRSIWKKQVLADATLSRYARFYEGNYRRYGGKHSSEERGLTPFEIPLGARTVSPSEDESTDSEGTGEEKKKAKADKKKAEEEKKKANKEKKSNKEKSDEEKKADEEKKKDNCQPGNAAAVYKTGLKEFEPKFRIVEDVEEGVKLTSA